MTTKTQKAAATLGAAKTPAKTAAARENGRRGGRPAHRYYRVDAPRDGAYGMRWDGTLLAVRPDGTGYLLEDRYESDRNGSECYRHYVNGKLRLWPEAAGRAWDVAREARSLCAEGCTVADMIREHRLTVEELIQAVRSFVEDRQKLTEFRQP